MLAEPAPRPACGPAVSALPRPLSLHHLWEQYGAGEGSVAHVPPAPPRPGMVIYFVCPDLNPALRLFISFHLRPPPPSGGHKAIKWSFCTRHPAEVCPLPARGSHISKGKARAHPRGQLQSWSRLFIPCPTSARRGRVPATGNLPLRS